MKSWHLYDLASEVTCISSSIILLLKTVAIRKIANKFKVSKYRKKHYMRGVLRSHFKKVKCTGEGFPCGSGSKQSTCNARGTGSIPGSVQDSLEKGMSTHSSMLAWEISWTEEPDGLYSP